MTQKLDEQFIEGIFRLKKGWNELFGISELLKETSKSCQTKALPVEKSAL